MAHDRRVLLRPNEDGWWVADCPSLPGCISQGKTRAEAIDNVREAIGLYIEVLQDDRDDVSPDDYADAELAAA